MTSSDFLIRRLEEITKQYDDLTAVLSDPTAIEDSAHRIRLLKERATYGEVRDRFTDYCILLRQIAETDAIHNDKGEDSQMREWAALEWTALEQKRVEMESVLKRLVIPRDPKDDRDLFLEIRAGTGGEEAALFVSDLLRMYSKYAEHKGWRVEIVGLNETGIGGVKEAILSVAGKGAYRCFRYESGVHRVQRVPETEASGRIHTSTVTVAAIPEADEVEIQIDPKDVRIDTFCSSGAGGQSVNTTYSAVRLTHLPTGLVVSCQDERSQLKNRNKGMRVLRSRLLAMEQTKQQEQIAKDRKSQVGTGDRSEKIRTYNFKEGRITDHRINLSLYQLDRILEGEMDTLIDALALQDENDKLSRLRTAAA